FAGGEPHPDAPPAPVNAVPAPEPVSTPSGGGGQGSMAIPAPKSAVDKLTDSFVNHAKNIAINQSKEVTGNKVDVGHMRDFD
ncbi:P-type conjugative transfer protein TrbL, partial [Acidithiobacillus ferrooxidans]|nr:P-type conjugative transfer protein TrbL [Acidithiobacillus ferrooxidans]